MPKSKNHDLDYTTNRITRNTIWQYHSPHFPQANIKNESLEELSLLNDPNPCDEIIKHLDTYDFENDIRTWIR